MIVRVPEASTRYVGSGAALDENGKDGKNVAAGCQDQAERAA